ncbi:hypothetical protein [Nostoc linckia]|uniref:hypothetical protein n=1 Tax=Nostoc linckia TaxID=92942 RepID=UPI0015D49404|nr:hypothetical protein [Nostoc linckia]
MHSQLCNQAESCKQDDRITFKEFFNQLCPVICHPSKEFADCGDRLSQEYS